MLFITFVIFAHHSKRTTVPPYYNYAMLNPLFTILSLLFVGNLGTLSRFHRLPHIICGLYGFMLLISSEIIAKSAFLS